MLLKSSVLSSRREQEETKNEKAITFLLHSNTTRGATGVKSMKSWISQQDSLKLMQITQTGLVKVLQIILSYSLSSHRNLMLSVFDSVCCCAHNFQHSLKRKKHALTFESQVAKEGGQKVHNVHNKDGDVGHLLHFCLRWAKTRKLRNCHILQRCADKHRRVWLTCGARCRWGGPPGDTRRQKRGWEWCTPSARNTNACN